MRPDLFNGWGIRTLSADHPSYNPFSYHLGSVWPVEVATFANGAKRYGFDDVVETLATGLYSAAGHCHMLRLPEVLAGHSSEDARFPTTYPGAKSPQAWSSSATISILQSLLGVLPFAPAGMLGLVRPKLPDWLPQLTVRGIRVGEAKADLRFERRADGSTDYDVLATDGTLRVARVPPPNAAAAGRAERAARLLMRLAPGRVARAGRIAMGIETG
jgi:glycogen debranching enzyme